MKTPSEVLRKPKTTDKDSDKDSKGKPKQNAMLAFIAKHKASTKD